MHVIRYANADYVFDMPKTIMKNLIIVLIATIYRAMYVRLTACYI